MTLLRKQPAEVRDLSAENFALRRRIAELGSERDALAAQLTGDIPRATVWLQTKVWRQRRALDQRERKLLTLRFALRLMNALREPVTAQEWAAARDAARLRDRIDEEAP